MPAVLTLRRILTFLSKGLSLHINKDVVHSQCCFQDSLSKAKHVKHTHKKKNTGAKGHSCALKSTKSTNSPKSSSHPPSLPPLSTDEQREESKQGGKLLTNQTAAF